MIFDWITPLSGLVGQALLGEKCIAVRGAHYGYEVGDALSRAHIRWHAGAVEGNTTLVNVAGRDYARAIAVLQAHGWTAW